jgi:hypothetical protein
MQPTAGHQPDGLSGRTPPSPDSGISRVGRPVHLGADSCAGRRVATVGGMIGPIGQDIGRSGSGHEIGRNHDLIMIL